MRRLPKYIHELPDWPQFSWQDEILAKALADVRHRQGKVTGRMEALGFSLRNEATLQTLTLDVIKSSEIEGEILNREQVRSSIARRLGLDVAGVARTDRHVDGIVEMMLDATQNYRNELTSDRLFGWHAAMFPAGRSGMRKITTGAWRDNAKDDPMQVVSGPLGKEHVHFEAPDSSILGEQMSIFLKWFNEKLDIDPLLKAGVAHLWFVTIHPFDDGNGRIARAIADLQLARSDESSQRFYSMSAQIQKERSDYYKVLETSQKGTMNITSWLEWFISCLSRALSATEETLSSVLVRARFWDTNSEQAFNERQKLMLNKLIDQFPGKLTTSKWAKIADCSHDTALRDIQDLVDRNILVKGNAGGRSTGYLLNSTNK